MEPVLGSASACPGTQILDPLCLEVDPGFEAQLVPDARDVREGTYDLSGGLGLRSDDELRELLAHAS